MYFNFFATQELSVQLRTSQNLCTYSEAFDSDGSEGKRLKSKERDCIATDSLGVGGYEVYKKSQHCGKTNREVPYKNKKK